MTALSAEALTTVADVKELLGITTGAQDNLITRNINMATKMILNYCGVSSFRSTAYTEYYDAIGGDHLVLRNKPIIALTSLSYRNQWGNNDSWTALDAELYYTDLSAGLIQTLTPLGGSYDSWKVVYTAGYATIPEDLAEVCARLAANLTQGGVASQNIKSKREGQRQVEYFDSGTNRSLIESLGLDDILEPYADVAISGLN